MCAYGANIEQCVHTVLTLNSVYIWCKHLTVCTYGANIKQCVHMVLTVNSVYIWCTYVCTTDMNVAQHYFAFSFFGHNKQQEKQHKLTLALVAHL